MKSRRLIVLCIMLSILAPLHTWASEGAKIKIGWLPERDCGYLPSSFAHGREVFRAPQIRCIDCSEVVQYTAFDGKKYTLTKFSGKNIAMLFPDDWLFGDDALTVTERRELVDLADLHYEHLKELLSGEPPGEGLLPIAIIPETCGGGCGYVGAKGVEVLSDGNMRNITRSELEAGALSGFFAHEINHNFDVFSAYWGYLPDHAHAWSDFIDPFIVEYDGLGLRDQPPRETTDFQTNRKFLPYSLDPNATWSECVRDGLCEARGLIRNYIWGGMMLRLARLHGTEAIRETIRFLRGVMVAQPTPPSTPEAKEDLHILALAAGAGLNLGCYVDAWRWNASSQARTEMSNLYGNANLYCEDTDGDGFSAVTWDCRDDQAAIHLGATEFQDGLDQDCDGLIDEAAVVEPQGGDFDFDLQVPYPAELKGSVTTSDDSDRFQFVLPAPNRVSFTVCSTQTLKGFFFIYKPDGAWLDYGYLDPGQCLRLSRSLNEAGTWKFGFENGNIQQLGDYTIRFGPGEFATWPLPWGAVRAPSNQQGIYQLGADVLSLSDIYGTPTQIRFWVAGVGFVASVPFASSVTAQWGPPPELATGTYSYRGQLLNDNLPASPVTAPIWFDFPLPQAPTPTPTPEACFCPDSDNDGVPDAWDLCPETQIGAYTDAKGCPGGKLSLVHSLPIAIFGVILCGILFLKPASKSRKY